MDTDTENAARPAAPAPRRGWIMKRGRWLEHPGVRGPSDLTLGERSADRLRNGMGSWTFVFAALVFLAVWMAFNGRSGFDPYPFILLNLLLSCLAAMQGAILLIAARRADQVSSELAVHDYDVNRRAVDMLEALTTELAAVRAEQMRAARPTDPED